MSTPNPNPPEHAFESFPEPRTWPEKWHTEALTPPQRPASPPADMPMETFPEPNTIPSGWDTSSMQPLR